VHHIKIALLGPIVPQSNPVLLAEEMAMLDTMAEGRLIVGMLRGTTNEMLTYDLNPEESRERTDEGMELILRAGRNRNPSAGREGISIIAPCRCGQSRCSSRCRRCTPSAPAARPAISRRATISASACRSARSTRWAR
jgi:hypothetical protein